MQRYIALYCRTCVCVFVYVCVCVCVCVRVCVCVWAIRSSGTFVALGKVMLLISQRNCALYMKIRKQLNDTMLTCFLLRDH